jgi:hypothetical protein
VLASEEVWEAHLQCCEHGVCLANQPDDDGALLDGFACIFDLEDTSLWRAVTCQKLQLWNS